MVLLVTLSLVLLACTFCVLRRGDSRANTEQDKEVQGVQKLVPYKIVDGQDGAAWVEVQGNKMSPSQVCVEGWVGGVNLSYFFFLLRLWSVMLCTRRGERTGGVRCAVNVHAAAKAGNARATANSNNYCMKIGCGRVL